MDFAAHFRTEGLAQPGVKEAFQKWNDQNQVMQFNYHGEANEGYSLFPFCQGDEPYNGIFFVDMTGAPSGTLADTLYCDHGGGDTGHNFYIRFNEDVNWHNLFQTDELTENEFDLKGVATHEIGHATGWGPHFNSTTDECVGAPSINAVHTMCPGYVFGDGQTTAEARSLETHDIHTFDNAYADQ